MKVSKRIITFFLAVAMLFSLFTFATASSSSGVLVDNSSVASWNNWLLTNGGSSSEYWTNVNSLMSWYQIGSCSSLDDLESIVFRMDTISDGVLSFLVEIYRDLFGTKDYIVMYDTSLGVYRPYDNNTHLWLVNSSGHFPYFDPDTWHGGGFSGDPSDSSQFRTYSWWFRSDVDPATPLYILPLADLKSIAADYEGRVAAIEDYYFILDNTGSKILLNADNRRFAAYVNPDKSATNNEYNYYTTEGDKHYHEYIGGDTIINEGDTITNIDNSQTITNNTTNVFEGGDTYNNQFIDLSNGTFQNASGDIWNVDDLHYDASTHTYYIDAHDEYVYNSTTNEYETNNYQIMLEYHTNYTSVTYIGQTEEYEADTYVYYYQLPDGRSSADLTAEDLEQLSLAFTDVTNYARSTESADLRALYHFDGNTEDSSYWSYCTQFDWDYGASLTYMDEGTFGGSLYLDETSHLFRVYLPNERDLAGDFTIQFRYYQSEALSSSQNCCVSLGNPLDSSILKFTGDYFAFPDGESFYPIPVGTWNEVCIMRVDGDLHYYFNGVYISFPYSDATVYSDCITFYFYNDQQCYRKLDELRVTRGAVYTVGADYTPTSVPHDTNLSLILPDGSQMLADEVLTFNPSDNNLFTDIGFADWTSGIPSNLIQVTQSDFRTNWNLFEDSGLTLFYNPDRTSFVRNSDSVTLKTTATAQFIKDESYSGDDLTAVGQYLGDGLFLSLYGYGDRLGSYCNVATGVNHCFSVVYQDGSYDYIVFKITASGSSYSFSEVSSSGQVVSWIGTVNCEWNYYAYGGSYREIDRFGLYVIPRTKSADIVHMELVQGSSPQFTIDWEAAFYDPGELEDSPVLAVRSNTPISSYTFGGVRPVYPERGQVWAMIEGSRIVSLQQYTGSAWIEVDGRIWTGSRWIPYGSFDVFTLKDCYDIIGGSDDDFEYIYSEAGFWSWLQRAWAEMLHKLDLIILALGGDPDASPGGSSGDDSDLTFWQRVKKIFEESLAKIIESLLDLITRILDTVLTLVYDLLDFFFDLLTDIVINGIGDFFDTLTGDALLKFFQTEEPLLDEFGNPVVDENGDPVMVTVVSLPAGISGVFAFVSACIMVLPDELRYVLFFGVGALFLLAVLKLIKS